MTEGELKGIASAEVEAILAEIEWVVALTQADLWHTLQHLRLGRRFQCALPCVVYHDGAPGGADGWLADISSSRGLLEIPTGVRLPAGELFDIVVSKFTSRQDVVRVLEVKAALEQLVIGEPIRHPSNSTYARVAFQRPLVEELSSLLSAAHPAFTIPSIL